MAGEFPQRAALESALDLAACAPSARNTQPWRWHVDGEGLHLYADWGRALADTAFARRDVVLSCGAVLDHCVIALEAAGWRSRVHRVPAGRDNADKAHLAVFEILRQPARAGYRELAAAIARRRSDRRRFTVEPLAATVVEVLHVRAARLGVELGVVPRGRWARHESGDVRLRFGAESVRDTADTNDGAVLMVLGTAHDDMRGQLRAGEALSNVALSATALGLATCAVTEPLQDSAARLALACEVFDADAYPQALIRVGLAPTEGAEPAASARRPATETTGWDRA